MPTKTITKEIVIDDPESFITALEESAMDITITIKEQDGYATIYTKAPEGMSREEVEFYLETALEVVRKNRLELVK